MRKGKIYSAPLALAAALVMSGAAQAALHDRGGGLIYDDVLNVTWLQDANYAQTTGHDEDGQMTWTQATAWASAISYYDNVRGVTYDDWRLPATNPVNGVSFNLNASYDGSTDYGYNVGEAGTIYAGSTGSEMAHLFYVSLDNKGTCPVSTNCMPNPQDGWGLANVGPFINLLPHFYWSGASGTGQAWGFDFNQGDQSPLINPNQYHNVLLVRNGDVAAVPEPATYAMMLAGVGLVGWAARRRK